MGNMQLDYVQELISRESEGDALQSFEYEHIRKFRLKQEEITFNYELAKQRTMGLGFLLVSDPVGDRERQEIIRGLVAS